MTDTPAAAGAPSASDAILVVEDDAAVALLIVHVLERWGRRVVHASDGAGALRLLAASPADVGLALVDCGLPDVPGAALCDQLRRSRPGLPLLLTSGRGQPETLAQLAAEGPAAFMPKPFSPGELWRQVSGLSGGTS
jgi:CheY-like chemotaxis protein